MRKQWRNQGSKSRRRKTACFHLFQRAMKRLRYGLINPLGLRSRRTRVSCRPTGNSCHHKCADNGQSDDKCEKDANLQGTGETHDLPHFQNRQKEMGKMCFEQNQDYIFAYTVQKEYDRLRKIDEDESSKEPVKIEG